MFVVLIVSLETSQSNLFFNPYYNSNSLKSWTNQFLYWRGFYRSRIKHTLINRFSFKNFWFSWASFHSIHNGCCNKFIIYFIIFVTHKSVRSDELHLLKILYIAYIFACETVFFCLKFRCYSPALPIYHRRLQNNHDLLWWLRTIFCIRFECNNGCTNTKHKTGINWLHILFLLNLRDNIFDFMTVNIETSILR